MDIKRICKIFLKRFTLSKIIRKFLFTAFITPIWSPKKLVSICSYLSESNDSWISRQDWKILRSSYSGFLASEAMCSVYSWYSGSSNSFL